MTGEVSDLVTSSPDPFARGRASLLRKCKKLINREAKRVAVLLAEKRIFIDGADKVTVWRERVCLQVGKN